MLAGCKNPYKDTLVVTIDSFTQGTYYRVTYMSRDSVMLQGSIDSLLTVIDNSMSMFNPNSLLSRLNDNRTDSLDKYIAYCIREANDVSRISKGLYDITVLPLVEAWGFGTEDPVESPNIDSLLQFVGYEKIGINNAGRLEKLDPRIRINLNSIAKGYSCDLVGALIESRGIKNYLVEIGGEIMARGTNPHGVPWVVAIDKPEDGNMLPGAQTQITVSLTNKGIATSGNYRSFRYDASGRKIVHTVNPLTGQSSQSDLLSATVVAPTCARADALATAMVAMGVEKAVKLAESDDSIWVYLIYSDHKGGYDTYISPELKKKIVE